MHKRAKEIVKTLKNHGYIAYFAGGWVRDFLLKIDSDDIDIATNAPIEKIEEIFEKTIPIGAAFGIILVVIDKHEYEVATFRKDLEYKDGRRPSKIEFTTAFEDAKRRDFTINGMFYDPIEEKIIDYVHGKEDLKKKIIRAIGNPHERISEDRLRMLRAIRLSCKFDFIIEENTKEAIKTHSKELLKCVSIERIYMELFKMSKYDNFSKGLLDLFDFNILQIIFPSLKDTNRKMFEERIKYISSFPIDTPCISKILELFPNFSLLEKISLCKYLKLSNKDISFVEFYDKLQKTLKESKSDYDWVYLYANKHIDICLKIIACHKNLFEKEKFLKHHQDNIKRLSNFIERIKNKDPIIKACDLIKMGIKPGFHMGELLKKAEKISIEEKIEKKEEILNKLKEK